MPLNHVGGQVFRAPPPVTMPAVNLPSLDTKVMAMLASAGFDADQGPHS